MFKLIKISLSALALGLILLVNPRPTQAASAFNITTSPLPILLSTTPGQTVSTKLRVQNTGNETVQLRVDLKKFKANGATGKPTLVDRQPGDDYFDWASFSQTSFTAEPKVWKEITMTIKVPTDAAFGYYYAPVFSNVGTPDNPTTNANQVQGGTAVLVLLDVQVPGEKKQLEVTGFSADKKFYEYLPANFNINIYNSGDIHLAPSGSVFITRGSKTIAVLDVNPAGGNILPKSSRDFVTTWSDGFPVFEIKRDQGQIVTDKKGKPVYQLNWNFTKANHLRFGHYTAHLILTYDNGTQDVPIEATVSFWVVPWKILPVILLAIVLIGIGLWTSGRNLWRRLSSLKK